MLSKFTSSSFRLEIVNFGTSLNSPVRIIPTVARPFPRFFPLTTKLSKTIWLFFTEYFTFSNSECLDLAINETILLENIIPKRNMTNTSNTALSKYFKIFTKTLLITYLVL